MAENSNIEWTDHTFNPWRGCTKVSAGCKNCYAETLSKRNPGVLGIWGDNGTRVVAAEAQWKQPLKWNQLAQAAGQRHRVFCASLADVFEDRAELHAPRLRLLRLIYDTPHLDWLLLTKRPENIVPALRSFETTPTWSDAELDMSFVEWAEAWINGCPPANVWLGTSVENQEQADLRIPHLLAAPAAVRFLSCEPLLGPVDLTTLPLSNGERRLNCLRRASVFAPHINWVIVGGESGPGARPMHSDWARNLRDQCTAAGVSFFFKQWGEYKPFYPTEPKPDGIGAKGRTDWYNWPGGVVSVKLGKHAAGRDLGGRTWDQVPQQGQEVAA